jgi:hypothetical protein
LLAFVDLKPDGVDAGFAQTDDRVGVCRSPARTGTDSPPAGV